MYLVRIGRRGNHRVILLARDFLFGDERLHAFQIAVRFRGRRLNFAHARLCGREPFVCRRNLALGGRDLRVLLGDCGLGATQSECSC